jgi:hypothetical protein
VVADNILELELEWRPLDPTLDSCMAGCNDDNSVMGSAILLILFRVLGYIFDILDCTTC